MKENPVPPVIIIGMHRSGTSLLTRLLEKIGVFWGCVKDDSNESICFQLLNEQMLKLENCKWDDAQRLGSLFTDQSRCRRAARKVEAVVDDNFFRLYWGQPSFGQEKGSAYPALAWGFKDPRNTFTLPFWLERFPKAKVIHVIRNAVDVSVSLWRRETSRPEGRSHHHYSARCQDLAGCLSLWGCYVKRGLSYAGSGVDLHQLIYEDLLARPEESLLSVAGYLGISETDGIDEVCSMIDRSRSYCNQDDPSLSDFIRQAKNDPLMIELYPEECR
ncbi:MAG: sulfotransferase [Proteobacteria bacterium]|nr:sulfotransferase [Pseudomonadota bacterium]